MKSEWLEIALQKVPFTESFGRKLFKKFEQNLDSTHKQDFVIKNIFQKKFI